MLHDAMSNDTFFSSFEAELAWFKRVLNFRFLQESDPKDRDEKIKHLEKSEQEILLKANTMEDLVAPDLSGRNDPYASVVNNYELTGQERLILMLTAIPHLRPRVLDVFITKENVTEYGGIKGKNHRGFLPTGETALFLSGGNDLRMRFTLMKMFSDDHKFRKKNILSLEPAERGEPESSGLLLASREILDMITFGKIRPPGYSADFPAKKISTGMEWDDLVLAPSTQRQIEEVKIWLRQRERLASELGMGKRMKPGYKVLFHGSPGTGKTLTAQLLGKFIQKDTFRVDLSMVVSKYIGETEKNLAKIFDKAEHQDWILFFDEADALFGSRTKVSNSHDRYANQEVSYLLQRIEDYKGIIILASNMKGNIDDAFMRRFSSVVHFPFPKPEERKLLWQKAFPSKLELSGDIDLKKISDKYEISGANINNIVEWCSLIALEKGDYKITESMLREGMSRELAKESRTI